MENFGDGDGIEILEPKKWETSTTDKGKTDHDLHQYYSEQGRHELRMDADTARNGLYNGQRHMTDSCTADNIGVQDAHALRAETNIGMRDQYNEQRQMTASWRQLTQWTRKTHVVSIGDIY